MPGLTTTRWPPRRPVRRGTPIRQAALLTLMLIAGCATPPEPVVPAIPHPPPQSQPSPHPAPLIAVAEALAPVIGKVATRIKLRDGYLRAHPMALAYVRQEIRPLDIVLFSNKQRLSGHAGTGVFGHAAIHLGGERELRALGLWHHPAIAPHHTRIRDGAAIIESAPLPGTALADARLLTETDRLVVLRPPPMGRARRRAVMIDLFTRLGTPFDHLYRLSDRQRFFCTQLIDEVMPELALPRRAILGRTVILPDDIARAVIDGDSPLRLVLYAAANRQRWGVGTGADLGTTMQHPPPSPPGEWLSLGPALR